MMRAPEVVYVKLSCKLNVLSALLLYSLLFQFNVVEIECQIENACRHNEFRCGDGSACLRAESLCNGQQECPTGEDESGNGHWDCSKTTVSSDCSASQFRCRFGGCIPKQQVCDGVPQCWGADDESLDLCQDRIQSHRPRPKVPTTASRPAERPTISTTAVPPPEEPINTGNRVSGCQPPPTHEGSIVQCRSGNFPVNCGKGLSPEGTKAMYSCRRYWQPPVTGSKSATIHCRNGVWEQINKKWSCGLECGVDGGRKTAGFVVGGQTSDVGKWPWHVGFYHQNPPGSGQYEYFCGGSLISRRAVLTAAHCVTVSRTNEKRTDPVLAIIGKYNRTYGSDDHFVQVKRVAEIDVRADYSSTFFENDIAIAWLETNVKINERVRPVCIPTEEILESGLTGMLAGWGRWADRGYPEHLQEAELPVVGIKVCRDSHQSLETLSRPTTFCAGHRNGTSACDGDSGSGLMFEDRRKWIIQGIVSAGVPLRSGGCDPNHYTVFTRVDKYRSWIENLLDEKDRLRR